MAGCCDVAVEGRGALLLLCPPQLGWCRVLRAGGQGNMRTPVALVALAVNKHLAAATSRVAGKATDAPCWLPCWVDGCVGTVVCCRPAWKHGPFYRAPGGLMCAWVRASLGTQRLLSYTLTYLAVEQFELGRAAG